MAQRIRRLLINGLINGLVLIAGAAAGPAGTFSASAMDARELDFFGLSGGATIAEIDAAYPLETRVIYTEPTFPSLGIYMYIATHRGERQGGDGRPVSIRLRAEFDRFGKLFAWDYVETAKAPGPLRARLEAFTGRHGAADRVFRARSSIRHDYGLAWRDGNLASEARLRLILEPAHAAGGARLSVNFIDNQAESANYAGAYHTAVIAERDRVSDGTYIHQDMIPPICPEPGQIRCAAAAIDPGNHF